MPSGDPQPYPDTLPRPIAFVLSGGSSLGAVQVGMLQAMQAHGITPDLLVGTSAGAVNAAYIGQGFTLDRLAKIWIGLRMRDVFGSLGWRRLARTLSWRATLASSNSLRDVLERHLPFSYMDLTVPTTVVAADILTGEAVLLSDGELRRNVLASAAIPGIFPPVTVGHRLLADGGLVAHVPLLPAMQSGARTLLVCDAGYPCMLSALPKGALGYTLHLLTLIIRQQSLGVLSLVNRNCTVLYLPTPCPLDVPLHDFSRAAELIEAGYQSAYAFLAALHITGPGIYGHPHFHAGLSAEAP